MCVGTLQITAAWAHSRRARPLLASSLQLQLIRLEFPYSLSRVGMLPAQMWPSVIRAGMFPIGAMLASSCPAQEYPTFYDKVEVAFARSDNGSGTRKSVRKLVAACERSQHVAPNEPSSCYVHEMLKSSQGHKSWASQFGQLRRRWSASGLLEHLGDFDEAYQSWMWRGVRCSSLEHFRLLGQLLSEIAQAAAAPRSADQCGTRGQWP